MTFKKGNKSGKKWRFKFGKNKNEKKPKKGKNEPRP